VNTGCCENSFESKKAGDPNKPAFLSGCMVCGAELVYHTTEEERKCHYCGKIFSANAECKNGHFVCDGCHELSSIETIKSVCLLSSTKDASIIMQEIRSHSIFPLHGPEHHSLVPAVILAALRNCGIEITDKQIIAAIERGRSVPGGACAFNGACGAAVGAGIALSILIEADPYDGEKRQFVQTTTARVLGRIASLDAPRCCQRDSWIALNALSEIFKEKGMLSFEVSKIKCSQFEDNFECIHSKCPLWAE
jgi:hypothetical protein